MDLKDIQQVVLTQRRFIKPLFQTLAVHSKVSVSGRCAVGQRHRLVSVVTKVELKKCSELIQFSKRMQMARLMHCM